MYLMRVLCCEVRGEKVEKIIIKGCHCGEYQPRMGKNKAINISLHCILLTCSPSAHPPHHWITSSDHHCPVGAYRN